MSYKEMNKKQELTELVAEIVTIPPVMKLKVKKLNLDATLPTYATDGSNGLDLVATSIINHKVKERNKEGRTLIEEYVECRTGISVEIPKGYVGLLFPRSSVSKKNLVMANSVGVIDSDYRGEIMMRFKVLEVSSYGAFKDAYLYEQGDKIGQLILFQVPKLEVEEVKELGDTERGSGGFGSTTDNLKKK
jgi:dUTP pyrophosphatase